MKAPPCTRSIVINKKRLEKIRRRMSDPDADVPVKTMFEVDDGDSIYNADAIAVSFIPSLALIRTCLFYLPVHCATDLNIASVYFSPSQGGTSKGSKANKGAGFSRPGTWRFIRRHHDTWRFILRHRGCSRTHTSNIGSA